MAETARLPDNRERPGNQDSAPPGREQLQNLENGKRQARARGHGSDDEPQVEQGASGGLLHDETTAGGYYAGGSLYKAADKRKDKPKKGIGGWSRRRKIATSSGIGGVIAAGVIALILSSSPFGLIYIKHVVTDKVAGTEEHSYQLGRKRLYSTQFFFDKNGNFDGQKVGGIRKLMFENRSTKSMVNNLRTNGYQITFSKDTGKVVSLAKLGSDGKPIANQTYSSNSAVERAWSIKNSGDLNGILREVYPDKSDFWYNRASKQLYSRWGLTRTNWLKDKIKTATGVTKLESAELQFRSALRQKLFGVGDSTINADAPPPKDSKDLTPDEQTQQNAEQAHKGLFAKVRDNASSLKSKMLADPTFVPEASINDAAQSAVKPGALESDIGKSLESSVSLSTLNALNAEQKVCEAHSALGDVVTGARVLRAAQLMKFSLAVLSMADAMQNGKSVDSTQINSLMQYLNSTDSNGKSLFASSGFLYWTNPNSRGSLFSSYDKNQRDDYSVGGGFTGTLAGIKANLDHWGAGKPCSVVSNPFVSFGALGLSLVAGVVSLGTFTVTDVGLNAGISIATSFAISVATQMLTPMVAGTIINGAEHGTGIGNAFISGAEALTDANGASTGMRPLTTNEFKTAQIAVAQDNQEELANSSILARLFSPNLDHSLTTTAMLSLNNFHLTNLVSTPLASLGNIFKIGSIFGHPVLADTTGNCPDSDFKKHDLASTPFCNPVMGIPDSVLNDPNYAPDVVDQRMSCLDNQGNKVCDDPQVDENGNAIAGSPYEAYLLQCTSDTPPGASSDEQNNATAAIDILHNRGSSDFDGTCTNQNPNIDLFTTYHLYLTAAQGENDALTGNLSSNTTTGTAPVASSPTTPTAPTGNAQQLAQQVLAAAKAGHIKFYVLKSEDILDGSTPEQNVQEIANGSPASTTTTCVSNNRGAKPPNPTTAVDASLLQFILSLSQAEDIQINALTGQCHSSSSSNHYQGKAVDFGCPFSVGPADSIGAKYNISDQTGETCANSGHYHYSIGGN